MAISLELAGIFFSTSSRYSFLRRSRLSQETSKVASCLVCSPEISDWMAG